MDASAKSVTPSRVQNLWDGVRFAGAMFGAFGFGLQVDRVIDGYRHTPVGTILSNHAMLGVIFLFMAISNSYLLFSQIRKADKSLHS